MRNKMRNKNRVFSLFGLIISLALVFAGGAINASFRAAASDGEVIEISSALDLAKIGRVAGFEADKSYKLTQDITLPLPIVGGTGEISTIITDFYEIGTYYSNITKGWKPIPSFTGDFDGNGFLVKGVAGNRFGEDAIGLFGTLYGNVRNLKVEVGATDGGNVYNLSGQYYIGGIAGQLYGGLIENCRVWSKEGTSLIMSHQIMGGAVGHTAGHEGRNAVIRDTLAETTMGIDYVAHGNVIGGFVGYSSPGVEIYNCVSRSHIASATSDMAGFVSMSESGSNLFINCVSATTTFDLPVKSFGGGFIAILKDNTTILRNCVSLTDIRDEYRDPFVRMYTGGTIENCYIYSARGYESIHATSITREEAGSEFFINNVLNGDYGVFKAADESFITLADEFLPLNKTLIEVDGGTINKVNGSELLKGRPTKLTSGTYELDITLGGEDYSKEVTLSSALYPSGKLSFFLVSYHDEFNEIIKSELVDATYDIQSFLPIDDGRTFLGWFTAQEGGEKATTPTKTMSVWAVYDENGLIVSVSIGDILKVELLSPVIFGETFLKDNVVASSEKVYFYKIPHGLYQITIKRDGYITNVFEKAVYSDVENTQPQTKTMVRLTLTTVAYAQIEIINADNKTIEKATTASLGTFSSSNLLVDGTYSVRISKSGFKSVTRTALVNRANVRFTGTIALSPVTLSGSSAAGSVVTLYRNNTAISSLTVAESGTFLFGELADGEYMLVSELEGHNDQTANVVIYASGDAEHNFSDFEKLVISGKTSAKTTVSLYLGEEFIASVVTDKYGEFSFTNIIAAEYTLVFERAGFKTQSTTVSTISNTRAMSVSGTMNILSREKADNVVIGYIIEGILVLIIGGAIYFLFHFKKYKRKAK